LSCVGRSRLSTKPTAGPAVIERIARSVREAVDECDLDLRQVQAVGVGAPGSVNPEKGEVIFSPNLPGWEHVPLQKALTKLLDRPVRVENDCNVCTLGVYHAELKAKPRHMVGIFLGTGMGGGLILDGKLFSGFNRTAGEIGHMVLEVGGSKCGCGNRGCFEALAGRAALFRRIQCGQGRTEDALDGHVGAGSKEPAERRFAQGAQARGQTGGTIVEEAAEYTGIAVANVINLLNPEVVVLGGGMIQQLEEEMMAIIVETAQDYAMTGTWKGVEIVASELGDDAGITGAAVLAQGALG
jgi:glucokinase